jgi:hypothetical protein
MREKDLYSAKKPTHLLNATPINDRYPALVRLKGHTLNFRWFI